MTNNNEQMAAQEEYIALRYATDPIEAFNLFIKRNCPDLYSHFIDSDDNEAEFVRRTITTTQAEAVITELEQVNELLSEGYAKNYLEKRIAQLTNPKEAV